MAVVFTNEKSITLLCYIPFLNQRKKVSITGHYSISNDSCWKYYKFR